MAGKLAEKIAQRIDAEKPNTATYDFHGHVTRVYADDHLLALAIQDFLRPFRGAPGDTADIEFYLLTRGPDDELLLDGKGGGNLLYDWQVLKYVSNGSLRYQEVPGAGSIVADMDEGIAVAFIDSEIAACSWSVAHVIFFPMWAQLLKTRGIFPVHAAGLVRDGRGILFPGKSNCGKSTLALKLLQRGCKLLGDDTVFLRDREGEVEMLFFPEEVDVCSDTVDLYPQLALARNLTEDRWQPKERVNLKDIGSDSVVECEATRILVFPVIAADGVTRHERVEPADALGELILYAFFFMDPLTTRENFALLASLVRNVSCHRLHMGLDGDSLARAIDEILATQQ